MTDQRETNSVTREGIGRATGFEVADRDRSDLGNIDIALARNRAFAAAGGHEGAVVFPTLRLFVITCLDPRVDPAHFLGLGLSDVMVVRNVGGRVTPEVINNVAFIGQLAESIVPHGPLFEVAVIHHTQCGTGALADDAFRRRYAERIGAEESSLLEHAVLDPAATVAHDVARLRSRRRSPRASPCPVTFTTLSPAWWQRSSPRDWTRHPGSRMVVDQAAASASHGACAAAEPSSRIPTARPATPGAGRSCAPRSMTSRPDHGRSTAAHARPQASRRRSRTPSRPPGSGSPRAESRWLRPR